MTAGEPRIDPAARIGAGVTIGPFTTVHGNVELGDGCRIGECCVLGVPAGRDEPLVVGAGATIRSHTVLYEGSRIGPGLETGHHVLIRAGCELGERNRIGTQTALEGEMRVGDHVRIQGYCVFGTGTRIGHFAYVFPHVVATNDPLPPSAQLEPVTIGDGAVVCAGNILYPGLDLGYGAVVASGADPRGVVPPAAVVVEGERIAGPVTHLAHLASRTAHPWMTHFTQSYPPEVHARLAELRDRVLAAAAELRSTSRSRG
jgi:UDP-3-O-[3-hydroxymyristoyl] glucosamine N-acyltransferase